MDGAARAAILALVYAIIAAIVFVIDGYELSVLVALFAAASALSAAVALGILAYRVARGGRKRWWIVVLAGVIAVEAGMVVGLNRYADAKTTASVTLLQDYSAEVAATASLGDSVAAKNAPSGVTFATLDAQAGSVSDHYSNLKLPSELLDYGAAVNYWAEAVQLAALAGEGGKPWAAPGPPRFRLSMTGDQADTAFTSAQAEIATLVEFGKQAIKDHDVAGIRYVGARLFAQYYWLTGVVTSADNTAITAMPVRHRALSSPPRWSPPQTPGDHHDQPRPARPASA